MKLKLDIVTGFLGSGKSVFINNLINETVTNDEKVLEKIIKGLSYNNAVRYFGFDLEIK